MCSSEGSHARPNGADVRHAFESATCLSPASVIQGVHATIGATLAYILGSAVLAPSMTRREPLWLNAASLQALPEASRGGHAARGAAGRRHASRRSARGVPRRSGRPVRALDSTCTHLGCRTRFNAETRADRMPLPWRRLRLAGTGDRGPAAAPLDELPTRIDGASPGAGVTVGRACSTGSTPGLAIAPACPIFSTNVCRTAPAGRSRPAASSRLLLGVQLVRASCWRCTTCRRRRWPTTACNS